jgi:3-keto-5-aminohexanoate cleavage enzyme
MTMEKPTFTGARRNQDARDPDLCVVTCALTGVLANRKQCPGIPYTPGRDRRRGEARLRRGRQRRAHPRAQRRRLADLLDRGVRADQGGDAGALPPHPQLFDRHDPRRRERAVRVHPREPPEIAALNMGTMNYSKYSRARKAFDFDMVFSNTYGKIIKLLTAMNEAGVKPELECFDTGHTHGVWPLLDMGVLKPPLQFSFIVNVLGGIPGHVESLQLQTKIMPAGLGVGGHRHQPRPLAHAGRGARARRQHPHRGWRITSTCRAARWRSRTGRWSRSVRMVRDVGRTPRHGRGGAAILGLGRGVMHARPYKIDQLVLRRGPTRRPHPAEPRPQERDRAA